MNAVSLSIAEGVIGALEALFVNAEKGRHVCDLEIVEAGFRQIAKVDFRDEAVLVEVQAMPEKRDFLIAQDRKVRCVELLVVPAELVEIFK